MTERVTARAWCRVDLAGGTLDIWPLGLLHPGARTVNLAVDLAVTAELEARPRGYRVEQQGEALEADDLAGLARHPGAALAAAVAGALDLPPFAARLASASPRGGGLGASSAMVVALLAAAEELFGRPRSDPRRLAALGRDLEARMMGLPTGVQDHWAAVLGGLLEISYHPGGEEVRRLPAAAEELGASLVLAFTGQGHFSAAQNWQVVRRRLEGEEEVAGLLQGIADAAAELAAALEAGDLAAAGRLMDREWSCRRRLAEGVSTPRIEELLAAARAAGAWGGKACGAGGGGSIALLAPPERRQAVAAALAARGASLLDARPALDGLLVERT
ncbi:MAG TPA: hypothetical protein VJG13_10295 [Thermoanaerobaculia bacterium]|nr:hypothetical protein [Thermoanaerobaculia bacterium]